MIDNGNITDEMLAAWLDGNASEEEVSIIEDMMDSQPELEELGEIYHSSQDWEHSPYLSRIAMIDDDWAVAPDDAELELLSDDSNDSDDSDNPWIVADDENDVEVEYNDNSDGVGLHSEDIAEMNRDFDSPHDYNPSQEWNDSHYGYDDENGLDYDGLSDPQDDSSNFIPL